MMNFSMKSMILFVTGVSIYLAVVCALPGWLSLISLMLITIAIPAVYVCGIVYSTGVTRAFCIGCVASAFATQVLGLYYLIVVLTEIADEWPDLIESLSAQNLQQIRIALVFTQVVPIVGGPVGVLMRTILHRPDPCPSRELSSNDHE